MVGIDWSASEHDDPAQNNGPQEFLLNNKLARPRRDDPLNEYRFVNAVLPEQFPNPGIAHGFATLPRYHMPDSNIDQLDGRYGFVRLLAINILNSENEMALHQALTYTARVIQARGIHLSESDVLNFNRNMVLAGCSNVQIVPNPLAGAGQNQWFLRYEGANTRFQLPIPLPLQYPIPLPMSSAYEAFRELPTRIRSILGF